MVYAGLIVTNSL